MNKVMLGLLALMLGLLFLGAQNDEKKVDKNDGASELLAKLEAEKAEIKRQWDNLKSFQIELDQRAATLETLRNAIEEREKRLNQRIVDESVNKQTVESYESIDPEQAAPLLIALFKEDENLTALLFRKMAAKKAGKILEAMIPLDQDLSTRLSQKILTYFSDKKK